MKTLITPAKIIGETKTLYRILAVKREDITHNRKVWVRKNQVVCKEYLNKQEKVENFVIAVEDWIADLKALKIEN